MHGVSGTVVALALAATMAAPAHEAHGNDVLAADVAAPTVFQATGPTAQSIQSTIEAFRAAVGATNNGNQSGPIEGGHRQINWDGLAGTNTTSPPVTPFNNFLNNRGAQFTTNGTGLTQAPPAGGPDEGLVRLFDNPTYATTFTTFSPLRLFGPVGSNVTDGLFFIPGTDGGTPAVVNGFGAVFTDVDLPDGRGQANGLATQLRVFDIDGKLLFRGSAPASPGDGNLSFLGVVFTDAQIARVRITTGSLAAGPNDDREHDIVMMDDFIYGEPQLPN